MGLVKTRPTLRSAKTALLARQRVVVFFALVRLFVSLAYRAQCTRIRIVEAYRRNNPSASGFSTAGGTYKRLAFTRNRASRRAFPSGDWERGHAYFAASTSSRPNIVCNRASTFARSSNVRPSRQCQSSQVMPPNSTALWSNNSTSANSASANGRTV